MTNIQIIILSAAAVIVFGLSYFIVSRYRGMATHRRFMKASPPPADQQLDRSRLTAAHGLYRTMDIDLARSPDYWGPAPTASIPQYRYQPNDQAASIRHWDQHQDAAAGHMTKQQALEYHDDCRPWVQAHGHSPVSACTTERCALAKQAAFVSPKRPAETFRLPDWEEHSMAASRAQTPHLPTFPPAEPQTPTQNRQRSTGSETSTEPNTMSMPSDTGANTDRDTSTMAATEVLLPHTASIRIEAAQRVPPRSDRELVYGLRAVCWAHPIEDHLIAPWMGEFHQQDSSGAWINAALDRAEHENEAHGRSEALAALDTPTSTY